MNTSHCFLPPSSTLALQLLKEGNQRFVNGVRSTETHFNTEKLKELAEKGQSPRVIVLTCADSRVPVETIFDLGLGEVFVIRVAGNVISSDIIASVEYAAQQFGIPLCVVMGHTECGAVQAAIHYAKSGECTLSGFGEKLLQKILPSAKKAIQAPQKEHSLVHVTVLMNIRRNLSLLIKKSQILRNFVTQQKFTLVGAIYDLHTGKVTFDFEHHTPSRQGARLTFNSYTSKVVELI